MQYFVLIDTKCLPKTYHNQDLNPTVVNKVIVAFRGHLLMLIQS